MAVPADFDVALATLLGRFNPLRRHVEALEAMRRTLLKGATLFDDKPVGVPS
jgi:hypothetical protein